MLRTFCLILCLLSIFMSCKKENIRYTTPNDKASLNVWVSFPHDHYLLPSPTNDHVYTAQASINVIDAARSLPKAVHLPEKPTIH